MFNRFGQNLTHKKERPKKIKSIFVAKKDKAKYSYKI